MKQTIAEERQRRRALTCCTVHPLGAVSSIYKLSVRRGQLEQKSHHSHSHIQPPKLTRRQALPELLSLLSVIDNQSVKVTRAADLELGDGGTSLGVALLGGYFRGVDGSLLDAGGCRVSAWAE